MRAGLSPLKVKLLLSALAFVLGAQIGAPQTGSAAQAPTQSIDAHLGKGYDALKQDRYDEAIQEFRSALAADTSLVSFTASRAWRKKRSNRSRSRKNCGSGTRTKAESSRNVERSWNKGRARQRTPCVSNSTTRTMPRSLPLWAPSMDSMETCKL